MPIRVYRDGDEHAQARVFNVAAGSLPGFKPSKAEEIVRRLSRGRSGSRIEVLRHR